MVTRLRPGIDRSDFTPRVKFLTFGLLVMDTLLLSAYAFNSIANRDHQFVALATFFQWQSGPGDPDNSAIEMTGHAKLLAAVIVLCVLSRGPGRRVLAVWGVILMSMIMDDFFQLHERIGLLMAEMTGEWSILGLNSEAVGELSFWLIVALPLGTWLLFSHQASDPSVRGDSLLLIASVSILTFFAAGVDALRAILDPLLDRTEYFIFHFIETGGEVVSMSLILSTTLLILERDARAERSRFHIISK